MLTKLGDTGLRQRPAHPFSVSKSRTGDAIFVGVVVYLAATAGIFSRPAPALADLWPANAILLGLFLRQPRYACLAGWLFAAIGYIGADLSAGTDSRLALWLNVSNICSVAVGYLLLSPLRRPDRALATPTSVLQLAWRVAIAAVIAGIAGGIVSASLLDKSPFKAGAAWFVSELVAYICILPVILTAPVRWRRARAAWRRLTLKSMLPVLILVVSCAIACWLNGPGAIVIPVPALLWCALSYPLFITSVITLLFSFWSLLAILNGILVLGDAPFTFENVLSIRLGVAMLALAPLSVGSVAQFRQRMLQALRHSATYDSLTGLLNRSSFHKQGNTLLSQLVLEKRRVAVLMLDVDHFKRINDTYGHAAGDQVLRVCAARIGSALRGSDMCSRIGGEEFAVLLPDCGQEAALDVAERMRALIAANPIQTDDGHAVQVTCSIGVFAPAQTRRDIEHLLRMADKALYAAKLGGRDRVCLAATTPLDDLPAHR